MLTVDFDRLRVGPGDLVLDVGCGAGRHSIEAARRGAAAVALDLALTELAACRSGYREATALLGAPLAGGMPRLTAADTTRLPFADAAFDVVIASEVLEHIGDDGAAIAELRRVLRPGGRLGVTVPRALPERICWGLSRAYHETPGGHVRIYAADELRGRLGAAGLTVIGSTHAHGLHSPYWWLRCAVGVDREPLVVRLYHRLLVWDLMERPWITRAAERICAPLVGKSLVVYAERAAPPRRALPTHGAAAA
ncbi:MAG TPA: methyltransferase domain-containing protein [Candidatus Dormibacteraeota bacterium]